MPAQAGRPPYLPNGAGSSNRHLRTAGKSSIGYNVENGAFTDAALLLVGHGTLLNGDSARPVYQHAADLRQRGLFGRVSAGFWRQDPVVTDVWFRLRERRVFILPLFISEGYFSEQKIPEALGFTVADGAVVERIRRRGDQQFFYCEPVGTHPAMTRVVAQRAESVMADHALPCKPPASETSLFIAGHGTGKNRNSRKAIDRQVEWLRARGNFAEVHAIFLEEQPPIEACYLLAREKNLVIVPYFISDGLHVQEDIPVLLGEPRSVVELRLQSGQDPWRNPTERQGKRVWYAPSVGTSPLVAEVILERVREASLLAPGPLRDGR